LVYLFSAWQEVFLRLKSAEHVLLLSDFDGTLAPIVERPDLAYLPQRTKRLLQDLAHRQHYTVGIISGRALGDLKDRVGLKGVLYAGNYGLEIEAPWFSFRNPAAEESKPLLRDLYQQLSLALETIKGVIVENKGFSLSVHYRLAAKSQSDEVRSIFERITSTARMRREIQVTFGKKVYEVRPAIDWDKGKVVELLFQKKREEKVLPLFLGDDLSDEEGFKAIDKYGGIAIFVGEGGGPSGAHYFLRSPAEVDEFLERLP
jgi:trehalose 6-phosphate phosphatase